MAHVIIAQTGTCGFTLRAKAKNAPFACKRCGSHKFDVELTMLAEAYPTGHQPGHPDPTIYADMDVYAASVTCHECDLMVPGSGYTSGYGS
jgi:hypothetical protein